MAPVTAYIGLGANVGDREAHIRSALAGLDATAGIRVMRVSTLRETEPVGGPPQGDFLNGVAALETTLPAEALRAVCRELERAAGRDLDAPRNHPRPLDLDILLYGEQRIDVRDLQVPHPRMFDRAFVLDPLAELGVEVGSLTRPERPRVISDPVLFAASQSEWLRGGCVTGLVPTMGALHEGHASLMRAAREECDRVAATVFVNPKQFGEGEDFAAYPRDLERDLEVFRREGVDVVFAPEPAAMYPDGFCTELSVGAEAADMEGASRPGHFGGVVTVVAKLIALARPDIAYFGRKDAQQVAVLRRMVADLGFAVEVRECPIVRDADGLALSSRNAYLSDSERRTACVLYRGLRAACDLHAAGERDAGVLLRASRVPIEAEPGVDLEYLELRREGDLRPLPAGPVLAGRLLVAARVGPARLIDNMSLGDP